MNWDQDNIYVQNLKVDAFSGFSATPAELLSFALDEVGLLGPQTMVNGKLARELTESFYQKRQQVRQNTRLGNLLISENIITKEQLIEALAHHVDQNVPLGQALVHLKLCTQKQLKWALKQQASLRKRLR